MSLALLEPGARVLVGGGYTPAYARLVDPHPYPNSRTRRKLRRKPRGNP